MNLYSAFKSGTMMLQEVKEIVIENLLLDRGVDSGRMLELSSKVQVQHRKMHGWRLVAHF